jgi:hypothetical protein
MPIAAANAQGDEFVGPFASWANLRRDYGAKGDGVSDDTKAVQAALSALSKTAGKSPVLFIPAGTYLINQTVMVQSAESIGVIGADPTTTTFKWGGASGGTLFHINGVSYSRFDRITFDGSGTAGVLVDQSSVPGTPGAVFDTGNEYADDVFQNGQIGIQGGQSGGASESSILRSKFLNNTIAGIALKNFNALDWWVWYSEFKNNNVGITNLVNGQGAGNFHAYNNVFMNSGIDLQLLNTGNFNFRDNFSLNSGQFLIENYYYTNAAVTRVQGNTIIMPAAGPPGNSGYVGNTIGQGNMGPMIMTDNTFVSPPNPGSHPPVEVYGQYWPDCISVGNTFTTSNKMTCLGTSPAGVWSASPYSISVDDQVVSAASVNQAPPTLPGVLPTYNRMVFEVPVGSNSTGIQNAINKAASYCGQRPIVHLPYGSYTLNQSINIPANCNIQLVGDGEQTSLSWGGSGSAIVLLGPSRAILRDFYLSAGNGNGTGIEVQNSDQPGSRIYGEQVSGLRSLSANIFVDGLDYALVELHDFQLAYTAVSPASTGVGLKVIGGPYAQQGKPQHGRTNLLAGSGGANYLTYQASLGASLIVRDAWYENQSGYASMYAQVSDNSSVTIEGSRMATSGGTGIAVATTVDAVQLNNLSCSVAVVANASDSDVKISGGKNENVWVVGNNYGTASSYFTNLSGPAGVAFNFNRSYDASQGYASVAIPDLTAVPNVSFVRATLAQSRNTHPTQVTDLVAGVTDVRLYRVTVELGNIGIHLER